MANDNEWKIEHNRRLDEAILGVLERGLFSAKEIGRELGVSTDRIGRAHARRTGPRGDGSTCSLCTSTQAQGRRVRPAPSEEGSESPEDAIIEALDAKRAPHEHASRVEAEGIEAIHHQTLARCREKFQKFAGRKWNPCESGAGDAVERAKSEAEARELVKNMARVLRDVRKHVEQHSGPRLDTCGQTLVRVVADHAAMMDMVEWAAQIESGPRDDLVCMVEFRDQADVLGIGRLLTDTELASVAILKGFWPKVRPNDTPGRVIDRSASAVRRARTRWGSRWDAGETPPPKVTIRGPTS